MNKEVIEINLQIKKEICYKTIDKLTDKSLLHEYIESDSVTNKVERLTKILQRYNVEELIITNIINDYLLELIPAGTKGVIRGNKFNILVKEYIINFKLDIEKYQVEFKKSCPLVPTN